MTAPLPVADVALRASFRVPHRARHPVRAEAVDRDIAHVVRDRGGLPPVRRGRRHDLRPPGSACLTEDGSRRARRYDPVGIPDHVARCNEGQGRQRVAMTFPGGREDLAPLAEATEVGWRDRFGAVPVWRTHHAAGSSTRSTARAAVPADHALPTTLVVEVPDDSSIADGGVGHTARPCSSTLLTLSRFEHDSISPSQGRTWCGHSATAGSRSRASVSTGASKETVSLSVKYLESTLRGGGARTAAPRSSRRASRQGP